MLKDSAQLSPESIKRYSQMSEIEAAQEFDRRKQALIQSLNQRVQKKPNQTGKTKTTTDLFKPTTQAEYIIYGPKSTQQIKLPTQIQSKLYTQKEDNDKNSVKSSPKSDVVHRIQEKKQIVQLSDGTSFQSYGSKERLDSLREQSEQKRINNRLESSNSQTDADRKRSLLGQLGQLDVEIHRLRVENEHEQRTVKKGSFVYEVSNNKPQITETQPKGIKEGTSKNLSQHLQSPKKGGLTYSSRVESKRKNIMSEFQQRIFCKELKTIELGNTQPQIKPLNIMIQFQQSIDNSRNTFSPNIQIQKDTKELSKHEIIEKRRTSQGTYSQQSNRRLEKSKANRFIDFEGSQSKTYQVYENQLSQKQLSRKMRTQNSPSIKSSRCHQSINKGGKLRTEESISEQRSNEFSSPANNAKKSINEAVELYTNLKNLLSKSQTNFNNSIRRQTSADFDYYNNDMKTRIQKGSDSKLSVRFEAINPN